ncbi:hypothetical protein [Streptomyces parvulus]|uniref:hypothetical protein n=1 Tax=Streptomyces parvulus TaxID=146923 RepID=UPI00342C8195
MSEDRPSRRLHDGQWVVSRAWITELTGASMATVNRWYLQRANYSGEHRFPEVSYTTKRTHYYAQDEVEAFWSAWKADVGTGRLQAAGRRPGDGRGNQGGGQGRARREHAIALALAQLRQVGSHRYGMSARLARQHGGSDRSWQRAMAEARIRYAQEGDDTKGDEPGVQPAL